MLRLDWQHTRQPGYPALSGAVATCLRSDYALRKAVDAQGGVSTDALFERGELKPAVVQTLLDRGFALIVNAFEPDTFFMNDVAALKKLGGDRVVTINASLPKADRQGREKLSAFFKEAGVLPYLPDDRPVLNNSLLIRLPGIRARQLVNALKLDGVFITNGEGCTLGLGQPSFVLQSYGFGEDEAREAISLSWDPALDEADLIGAAKKLLFRYRQIKRLNS